MPPLDRHHRRPTRLGRLTQSGIGDQEDLVAGDTLLARLYRIVPCGYVVVAASRRLQPIQVYSDEGGLALDDAEGFGPALVRDLRRQARALPGSAFAARSGSAWDRLLNGPLAAGRGEPATLRENGPSSPPPGISDPLQQLLPDGRRRAPRPDAAPLAWPRS